MIRKEVLFVVLFFIFSCIIPLSVFAQTPPRSSNIVDVNMSVSDTTDYELKGTVNLDNKRSMGLDGVSLVISLLVPGKTITTTLGGQTISQTGESLLIDSIKTSPVYLGPGEKKRVDFMLKYPATIASGVYQLTANMVGPDGNSQGSGRHSLSLSGSGTFLDINLSTCKIIVAGNDTYQYFEGPNIDKDQTGLASCVVKNTTEKQISARMNFLYAVNSVPQNPTMTKSLSSQPLLTFAPGQEQTVNFIIPRDIPPQVYEGLFQMIDTAGQKISVNVPFRWIIVGPSASIMSVQLAKTYYAKGQKANVTIMPLPSADLSWRGLTKPSSSYGTNLEDAKLDVTITDKDNVVCGKREQNLPSTKTEGNWNERIVSIPIERDCLNPKTTVRIKNDGKKLAEVSMPNISTQADIEATATKENTGRGFPLWVWILFGFFLLTGMGGIFYFMKKKHVGSTLSILCIIFCAVSLFVPASTFAQNASLSEIVKEPVNYTDAATKTVTLQQRYDNRTEIWGNVRDFAQNNTGGDSTIKVLPDCEKIEIDLKGTAGSSFQCSNWGPGLVVMPFIDGQGVKPQNPVSPIGDGIFDPAPNSFSEWISVTTGLTEFPLKDIAVHGPNSFNINRFNMTAGPREATFSITPTGAQKVGTHTLTLKVGVSHTVQHGTGIGGSGYFTTSFEKSTNCGSQNLPCYMLLKYTYTCGPPPACNAACNNKDACFGNKEGCTECRPTTGASGSAQLNASMSSQASGAAVLSGMTCQPPPLACNAACTSPKQCEGNLQGCSECRPDVTGQTTCQKPPLACNAACSADKDCFGNREGCSMCFEGTCRKPAACNQACETTKDCATAKDGCTACRPDEAGAKVCQPKFSPDMCSCDGIDFQSAKGDTFFPGDDVSFIAYGIVPGKNFKGVAEEAVESASVTSIQLSLYQSSLTNPNEQATRLAQSTLITPEIVENSVGRVRYKVTWNQKIPTTVPSGSLFRVQADVKCSAKPGVLGARIMRSTNYYTDLLQTIQSFFQNSKAVLGDTTDNQQADTFFPGAKISEKSCNILKFYFN